LKIAIFGLMDDTLTKNFETFEISIFTTKICFIGKYWSKTSKNEVLGRSELRFMSYSF